MVGWWVRNVCGDWKSIPESGSSGLKSVPGVILWCGVYLSNSWFELVYCLM